MLYLCKWFHLGAGCHLGSGVSCGLYEGFPGNASWPGTPWDLNGLLVLFIGIWMLPNDDTGSSVLGHRNRRRKPVHAETQV